MRNGERERRDEIMEVRAGFIVGIVTCTMLAFGQQGQINRGGTGFQQLQRYWQLQPAM